MSILIKYLIWFISLEIPEFKKYLRKSLRLQNQRTQFRNVRIVVISVNLIQPILCKYFNTDFNYLTKKIKSMLHQETEIQ